MLEDIKMLSDPYKTVKIHHSMFSIALCLVLTHEGVSEHSFHELKVPKILVLVFGRVEGTIFVRMVSHVSLFANPSCR